MAAYAISQTNAPVHSAGTERAAKKVRSLGGIFFFEMQVDRCSHLNPQGVSTSSRTIPFSGVIRVKIKY